MKTYEKKNKNILTITESINETHVTEEDRSKIQTQIDHLKLDRNAISEKIGFLEGLIAILDEE